MKKLSEIKIVLLPYEKGLLTKKKDLLKRFEKGLLTYTEKPTANSYGKF